MPPLVFLGRRVDLNLNGFDDPKIVRPHIDSEVVEIEASHQNETSLAEVGVTGFSTDLAARPGYAQAWRWEPGKLHLFWRFGAAFLGSYFQ